MSKDKQGYRLRKALSDVEMATLRYIAGFGQVGVTFLSKEQEKAAKGRLTKASFVESREVKRSNGEHHWMDTAWFVTHEGLAHLALKGFWGEDVSATFARIVSIRDRLVRALDPRCTDAQRDLPVYLPRDQMWLTVISLIHRSYAFDQGGSGHPARGAAAAACRHAAAAMEAILLGEEHKVEGALSFLGHWERELSRAWAERGR